MIAVIRAKHVSVGFDRSPGPIGRTSSRTTSPRCVVGQLDTRDRNELLHRYSCASEEKGGGKRKNATGHSPAGTISTTMRELLSVEEQSARAKPVSL